jgi:hypothetical protein
VDGSKRSIPSHDVAAKVGSDTELIAADLERPADLSRTLGESSMIVYCGDDAQVSQGFLLALRAMGIETNLPEGASTCLPTPESKQ